MSKASKLSQWLSSTLIQKITMVGFMVAVGGVSAFAADSGIGTAIGGISSIMTDAVVALTGTFARAGLILMFIVALLVFLFFKDFHKLRTGMLIVMGVAALLFLGPTFIQAGMSTGSSSQMKSWINSGQ